MQIQRVIIRDILTMLLDKASNLKNMLNNLIRMHKIFSSIRKHRQAELNIKLESIIGFLEYIGQIILLEFKDSYKELGIKTSPIKDNDLLFTPIRNEVKAFEFNSQLLTEMVEFYRDCIDCFFFLLRQNRKKLFDEKNATNLVKAISEARYSIGKLYEEYLMFERILDENVKN